MDLRPLWLAGLLGVTGLQGSDKPLPQGPSARVQAALAGLPPALCQDPFLLPPEAQAFARRAGSQGVSTRARLQALLREIFAPREQGGLGLRYDNEHTRSAAEVWQDGKANCLSLTAYFVASAKAMGIQAEYAEVLNTNHWRKVGNVIQFERHVVALIQPGTFEAMAADFTQELRKSFGTYVISVLPEDRFRAFYYSNLAVEAYTRGDLEAAERLSQVALVIDPKSCVGWNILGVVRARQGDLAEAEAAYRRAMALDPKDGSPVGNMEMLMTNAGRLEEAARFRQMGEKTRKSDPYFHAYLAEEALGDGHLLEASDQVHAALRILPKEPEFFLLLAQVKLATGDGAGAVKEVERARKLSEPSQRARYDSKISAIMRSKAELQN